nr:MAG TPA: ParA helix turn helix domain [Caudoviricetes sp.]
MKSWEIEIKILADDFGLPRSLVKSAIKKAKNKVVPEFYNGNEENFRYDEAHRLIMPYILGI